MSTRRPAVLSTCVLVTCHLRHILGIASSQRQHEDTSRRAEAAGVCSIAGVAGGRLGKPETDQQKVPDAADLRRNLNDTCYPKSPREKGRGRRKERGRGGEGARGSERERGSERAGEPPATASLYLAARLARLRHSIAASHSPARFGDLSCRVLRTSDLATLPGGHQRAAPVP